MSEAELASAALESAGIENSLSDVQTIVMMWDHSTALGGIRLHVAELDAADAEELLGSTGPDPIAEEAATRTSGFDEELETCPACGSPELFLEYGARRTLALLLLLRGFPLFFWRTRECCRACGVCRVVPIRVRPDIVIGYFVAAVVSGVLSGSVLLLFVFGINLLLKIR